jgi:hypothetical protein
VSTLRPDLEVRPVPDDLAARLGDLIDLIADRMETGEPAGDALKEINDLTGHSYTGLDFHHYWEWTDRSVLVFLAGQRPTAAVPDLTPEELVELHRRAGGVGPPAEYYREQLEANLHRFWQYPDQVRAAMPADLVEAARARRPMAL